MVTTSSATVIEIEGYRGEWFTVAGRGAGREGVWLAPEESGSDFGSLYDPPVETLWESTAFQLGATYRGHRSERSEFVLALHVLDTESAAWRYSDARLRRAFDYDRPSKLWVETADSRRWLSVRLAVQPRVKVGRDPSRQQHGLVMITLAADYPRWMEADAVDVFTTTTDTRQGGTESGTVRISNPTPDEVWLKWVVQGEADIQWTIADHSFGDDRYGRGETDVARTVALPKLVAGEHLRVDTDPLADQVVSSLDTAVYARMNGRTFLYPVPGYTRGTDLAVSVTGAPPGAGVQVRVPRPYSRPWGLED
ncbi:phage tail protein [Nocardia tengchongensis]